MKYIILLIVVILSLKCSEKNNVPNVLFEIENKKINSKDQLKIKIVNKTNENYFIILDTTRFFDYLTLNYKINNSILLKSKIFSDKDSINLKIEFAMFKLQNEDISNINCIQNERIHTQKIMGEIKKLTNIILLKKKSSFNFNIPFNSNFNYCSKKYFYSFKKGKKYFLQIEYKMEKKIIDEIVDKTQIIKLGNKGVSPYFDKIVSNKVQINP